MRLTNKIQSDNLHKRLDGYRKEMKRTDISASMNPAFEAMSYVGHHELVYEKLGQYEDVDESPEKLAKIKKALETIKEKNVWFWVFRRTHDVNEYNELVNSYYSECAELTQEEYDLLKEMLL